MDADFCCGPPRPRRAATFARRAATFARQALLLAALTLGPALGAAATTYTVTDTADSASDPGSVRAAVNAAQSGDTILFQLPSPSVITLTAGELALSQNVTIQGPGAEALTISGNNAGRVFDVTAAGPVQISGLTITAGSDPGTGGGGGLLMAGGGTLALTGCTLTGNTAQYGGGLDNEGGGVTLTGCTLTGNTAQYGGGLLNNDTVSLVNCTLTGNTAQYGGGGVWNYYALSAAGCTFSGNTSPAPGGGLANSGTASLTDCTLAGNASGDNGGGLFSLGGVTLTNDTFSGNSSAVAGGGLFNESGAGGTASLAGTIVAGNSDAQGDADVSGAFNSLGSNLIGTLGAATGFAAPADLVGVSPGLGPLQDNGGPTQTLALRPGSPAIAADADTSGVPTTDQRGVARPQGIRPDIGAYQTALTAADDAYTVTSSGSNMVSAASGVLANDTDGYGGQETAALVHGPGHGTLVLNADGSFTYTFTPATGFTGPDSFTYQLHDANGAFSNVATVTLTIRDTAAPVTTAATSPALPTGSSGSYTGPVTVTLSATDDLSGVAATDYTLDNGPQQTDTGPITISGSGSHTLTYHSVDRAGNVEAARSLTVTLSPTTSPGTPTVLHTFAPGLQMVAVPEDYSSVPLTGVWNAPAGQSLWLWTTGYVTRTALPAPGQGAWVRLTQTTSLLDSGTPVSTTAPFPIALSVGWNLVGDPFPAAAALSGAQIQDSQARTWTLPQAGARALLSVVLYGYPAGATQYQMVGPTGSLAPYQGYWLYAAQPCTLLLTPPPAQGAARH